jgi:hypothetical protein
MAIAAAGAPGGIRHEIPIIFPRYLGLPAVRNTPFGTASNHSA